MNDMIKYFVSNGITRMDIEDIKHNSPSLSPKTLEKAKNVYLSWNRAQKLNKIKNRINESINSL